MEIDPSRRARETSHGDSPLPVPRTKRDPDAQPEIRRAHETLLDGTARLYAQNANRTNVTGAAPSFNDQILYVGMNSTEVDGVAQNAREKVNFGAGVDAMAHGEEIPGVGRDHISAGGHVWDLRTDEGRRGFVATLALPEAQGKKIAAVLAETTDRGGGRDELAAIAVVWARAEHGQAIPSRIVLSGHSTGSSAWDGNLSGKDEGELSFGALQRLADAMPRAAAQVEDLMISGCNSGHEDGERRHTQLSSWQTHFPNLKTAWAYSADEAHSPTGSHAVSHIAAWRAATAGRTTHVNAPAAVRAEYHREWMAHVAANRDDASKPEPTAKLENSVAIWSSTDGYRRGTGRP